MAMTYESVLARLADIQYTDAITYYANMKQNFYNQFQQALSPEIQSQGAKFIDEFVSTIPNYTQGAWTDAFNFIGRLRDAIIDKLDGNVDHFPTIKDELDKKYSDLSAKGREELTNYINNVLDINEIVLQLLEDLGLMGEGNHTTGDIINWSMGWIRSLMFQRFTNPAAINAGNPSVLAGYFEEALFNQAAQKLASHIGLKTVTINTGSVKGAGNVDTALDQYFNFLDNMDNAETTFTAALDLNNTTLKSGFGAQVKLWKVPWETMERNRKTSYHIGNRAGLLEAFNAQLNFNKQRGWIEGVRFLESHVREALGDNVMYITNTILTWTCDLIKNFRQMQYFLAFHFKKVGEPSQGIGWEQIDMSKAEQ